MLGTEDGTVALVWTVVGQRFQMEDRVQKVLDPICRSELLRRPRRFMLHTEIIACVIRCYCTRVMCKYLVVKSGTSPKTA